MTVIDEKPDNPFRRSVLNPIENLPLTQESDEISEYAAAMAKFQAECPCPPLKGLNPAFRSKYALLQDVIDTVTPVLGKHGLSFSQRPNVRRDTEGKLRAIIVTTVRHESGQWERCYGFWPVDPGPANQEGKRRMSPAQAIKAALTYARSAELCSVLGIAGAEDNDGNEPDEEDPQPRRRNGAPRQPAPAAKPAKAEAPKPAAPEPEQDKAQASQPAPAEPEQAPEQDKGQDPDAPMTPGQKSQARSLCAQLGITDHQSICDLVVDVCGEGVAPGNMTAGQANAVIEHLESKRGEV